MAEPFGISKLNRQQIEDIFRRNQRQGQSIKIWIFGSRVHGTHRPYSDIDLLVEARPPFASDQKSTILDAFDESQLPYKIDLVERQNLIEAYRQSIEAEKMLFFELTP